MNNVSPPNGSMGIMKPNFQNYSSAFNYGFNYLKEATHSVNERERGKSHSGARFPVSAFYKLY